MNLSEAKKREIENLLPLLSDAEWQIIFKELKQGIKPSAYHTYRSCLYCCEDYHGKYVGETCYYWYTRFINGILDTIRSGKEDYCFRLDHILDLLRFEPQSLSVEWLQDEACFRVSICTAQ